MRFLTPDHWGYFKERRADGKVYFNGIRFEMLIREILIREFDGQWEPTPVTWDGGKDFVDRSIMGQETWAECKMYEKALSINKISNSLVLAINKQRVNQLLFFSYSPLNANAIIHLSGFSAATSIKVQVFDDAGLEQLILKDSVILMKYFGSFKHSSLVEPEGLLEIAPYFTTDTHVDYGQVKDIAGIAKGSKPVVSINTPCLYEIFLRSHQLTKAVDLHMDLSGLKRSLRSLGVLNWKKLNIDSKGILKKQFLPGQVDSIRLYLAPKRKGMLSISKIPVKFGEVDQCLPSYQIEVSTLNRPPLIGAKINDDLYAFNQRISASSTISSTVVTGKTGVGKTRFLEEAELLLLSQNYLVLHFDGHSTLCKNFEAFSNNLLAQIWRLPNTYLLMNSDDISSPGSSDTNTFFDRVCAILFAAKKTQSVYEPDLEEIFELIVSGMVGQRLAIIIDNVQSLDSHSLSLIRRISAEQSGQIGQNALVFAFNEDEMIFSQEAMVLHENLKNEASAVNKDYLTFMQIEEFSREHVEMFLNTICGTMSQQETFTEHYPLLTELICSSVLPRPLDIYQLFLAAQDRKLNIAFLKNGFFFIRRIDDFHDLVKQIQGKTRRIFEIRLTSMTGQAEHLRLLLILAQTGSLDAAVVAKIAAVGHQVLTDLVQAGWLKYGHSNVISYFHPAIERFVVTSLYPGQQSPAMQVFDESIRLRAYETIITSGVSSDCSLAVFSLNETPDENEFVNALAEIRAYQDIIPGSRISVQANLIFQYLLVSGDLAPQSYLQDLELLCKLSADGRVTSFVEKLYQANQLLSAFIPTSDREAYQRFKLIRQYASYLSSLGKPEQGDFFLQEKIASIELLPPTISEEAKNRIRINLINRRCVCRKSMGDISGALQTGRDALDRSINAHFPEFVCLSFIDIAAIYKNRKSDKNDFLKYVKSALTYYEEHQIEISDSSIATACSENEACAFSLNGEHDAAVKICDNLVRQARQRNDLTYLLKSLCMKGIFLVQAMLQKNDPALFPTKYIRSILNEVEDLSLVARMDRFYLKGLHLQAIYACLQGDILGAYDFFYSALDFIRTQVSERHSYYLLPSDKGLIYDAVNFWIVHYKGTTFPLSPALLEKTDLSDAAAALYSGKPLSPDMLFAIGDFNMPSI